MCKAIEDLCKVTYNEGKAEGIAEGMTKGIAEGMTKGICEFVRDGIISTAQGAFRAKLTEAEFKETMKKYGYQPT